MARIHSSTYCASLQQGEENQQTLREKTQKRAKSTNIRMSETTQSASLLQSYKGCAEAGLQPSTICAPIRRSRGYSILQLVSVNHFKHSFYMRRDGKFLFIAEFSIKEKTNFTLIQLAQESYLSFQAAIVLMTRRNAHIWGDTRFLGGTSFNGLCGKAPAERSTFFRLQVYKKCNSHSTYQPLIPRAFHRPQEKPWTRLYLSIINQR